MAAGRYLLLLALTIKLLSRVNHETFYPEQPQCLKSLLSGKNVFLTLYILPLSHFPVFTKFSNTFILADEIGTHDDKQKQLLVFLYILSSQKQSAHAYLCSSRENTLESDRTYSCTTDKTNLMLHFLSTAANTLL